MPFATELRLILRRLTKSPGFLAVTLLTLALGIGANTAIFTVIEGVLLKPLAYHDSDQLVALWLKAPGLNVPQLQLAPSVYFHLREESKTLEHTAAWNSDTYSVTGLGEPEEVNAVVTTFDLFTALGVRPALGRVFTEADDKPGAPKTVVLTHGYWMRKFGGESSVIGKTLLGDGQAREIIGVLPADFRFLDRNPQFFAPIQFDRTKVFFGNFSYNGLARLKPGATVEQANAEFAAILPQMSRKFKLPPGMSLAMFEAARIGSNFQPLKENMTANISGLLWILMGTLALVLLIAGANVANLLLVRAEGRHHELAIRASLGASRSDLARELLAESLLLGLAGGAAALFVAYGAIRLLVYLAPAGLPRLADIHIDAPVVLFTFAVSLIAGLLFGLIPVYRYARQDATAGSLREGGRSLSQSKDRLHARNVLVVTQVALAVVLLVGAGLMIRTFYQLSKVDPGFSDPEHVLTLRTSITGTLAKADRDAFRIMREILDRIQKVPGVEQAAFGGSVPMDGSHSGDPVFAEDRPIAEGQMPPIRQYRAAAPGLPATLGNHLIAGRDFTWAEHEQLTLVAMISENLAREFWGDPQKAIGKRVRERPGGLWREIVGVTADSRDDGLNQPAPKTLILPMIVKDLWDSEIRVRRFPAFVIRSPRANSQAFVHEVQQAIWSVNPSLTISRVKTMREFEQSSLARTSFTLVMLGIAGAMALLLGIIGIYGVIAYSVSQRRREIGIRTALGASAGALKSMFLRQAMILAGIGACAGIAAALGATRSMTAMLYGVSPFDPVTFLSVPFVLISVALMAAYLPARRATRVDPSEALRAD